MLGTFKLQIKPMILLHQHCSKMLFFSIPVIFAFSTRDIFAFIDTNLKKIIIVDRIIHKYIIPAFFIIIAFFPLPYLHFCLIFIQFSLVQSATQSCPTLCDPMNCSTPGLPVHHQLLEFTQTHIHRVGDAIQPSHPLSSPSPPAPNPSQNQSLFQ